MRKGILTGTAKLETTHIGYDSARSSLTAPAFFFNSILVRHAPVGLVWASCQMEEYACAYGSRNKLYLVGRCYFSRILQPVSDSLNELLIISSHFYTM